MNGDFNQNDVSSGSGAAFVGREDLPPIFDINKRKWIWYGYIRECAAPVVFSVNGDTKGDALTNGMSQLHNHGVSAIDLVKVIVEEMLNLEDEEDNVSPTA